MPLGSGRQVNRLKTLKYNGKHSFLLDAAACCCAVPCRAGPLDFVFFIIPDQSDSSIYLALFKLKRVVKGTRYSRFISITRYTLVLFYFSFLFRFLSFQKRTSIKKYLDVMMSLARKDRMKYLFIRLSKIK